MAESTIETIRTRNTMPDRAVEAAESGSPPPRGPMTNAVAAAAAPAPRDPRFSRSNADSKLPDNESIFHKVKRGLGME